MNILEIQLDYYSNNQLVDNLLLTPTIGIHKINDFVNISILKTAKNITISIDSKKDIVLNKCIIKTSFKKHNQFNINGFQSWSSSFLCNDEQELKRLRNIANPFMGLYGDYHFFDYQKDYLHSFHYLYCESNEQKTAIRSLNETNAYTIFEFNPKNCSELLIHKDVQGWEINGQNELLNIELKENISFYEDKFSSESPKKQKYFGWTSWYRHYTKINEQKINKDFQAAINFEHSLDYFQIDDGWQMKVGDWKLNQKRFPNGFHSFTQTAKNNNIKPGLWLAPFICEKASDIYKNHKDWLIKDDKGKPIKMGLNPMWSGWFYGLNIFNIEVQEYLTEVFTTVCEDWNFDLLKLDFLFAVAVIPQNGLSRAGVMNYAMHFLNKICSKEILGCGVPITSAMNTTTFCRIGADVHLSWENSPHKWLRNRERVSTKLAIENTISRFVYSGNGFLNDPDVFILRKDKNSLSIEEQWTLLHINVLLGDLIFTSDALDEYDERAKAWLNIVLPLKSIDIQSIELYNDQNGVYEIYCSINGQQYLSLFNLTEKDIVIHLKKSINCIRSNKEFQKEISLKKHKSIWAEIID